MIVTELDGLPVRLRAPHDLSFTARWGRVFVTYAGAPTVRYDGDVAEAAARATQAERDTRWPSVAALAEAWRAAVNLPACRTA